MTSLRDHPFIAASRYLLGPMAADLALGVMDAGEAALMTVAIDPSRNWPIFLRTGGCRAAIWDSRLHWLYSIFEVHRDRGADYCMQLYHYCLLKDGLDSFQESYAIPCYTAFIFNRWHLWDFELGAESFDVAFRTRRLANAFRSFSEAQRRVVQAQQSIKQGLTEYRASGPSREVHYVF